MAPAKRLPRPRPRSNHSLHRLNNSSSNSNSKSLPQMTHSQHCSSKCSWEWGSSSCCRQSWACSSTQRLQMKTQPQSSPESHSHMRKQSNSRSKKEAHSDTTEKMSLTMRQVASPMRTATLLSGTTLTAMRAVWTQEWIVHARKVAVRSIMSRFSTASAETTRVPTSSSRM